MKILSPKIDHLYPFFLVLGGGIMMGCTPRSGGSLVSRVGGDDSPVVGGVAAGRFIPNIRQKIPDKGNDRPADPRNISGFSKKNPDLFWGLGCRLLWSIPSLDYRDSSHDLDGRAVVSEFGDRYLLLAVSDPRGRIFRGSVGGNDGLDRSLSFLSSPYLIPPKTSGTNSHGDSPVVWLEGFFSLGDLWWNSLAYTQSPTNLAILQLGKISGPNTITAAIVAINGLLAAGIISWQTQGKKLVAGGLGLFTALHLLGWGIYNQPIADIPEQAMKIGIIQGNIPNTIKLYPEGWRKAIAGYTSGYEQLADQGVIAVLTPETALPFLWSQQVADRSSFYRAILAKGVMVWIGGFGMESDRLTNSLFTVTGKGETVSHYNKFKLVPWGNIFPSSSSLVVLSIASLPSRQNSKGEILSKFLIPPSVGRSSAFAMNLPLVATSAAKPP